MSSSFTPIIFCGPGSSLYPLCDADDETSSSIPKACLPILNLPLISFPLQSILNSGSRKVFVLAKGNQHSEIIKSLSKVKLLDPSSSSSSSSTSSDQSNIQIHQITNIKDNSIAISLHPNNSILVELIPLGPSDQSSIASKKPTTSNTAKENENPRDRLYDTDRPLGTAELLRWLAINGKIQAPPLILPLDFISPSFSLTDFLLNYHSSSLPSPPILQTIFYEKGYESKSSLLSKEREKDLNASSGEGKSLLIGFDSDELSSSIKTSQNHLSNTSDGLLTTQHNLRLITPLNSDEGNSELDLRSDLLKKSHKLKLSKKFSDSSIYILDLDKILPLLILYPKITSIRQHLLPFIVKCSWQSGLKSKVGWKFPSESSSSSSSLDDGEEGDDSSENARRRGSVNQLEQEKENETIDYREISSKKAGIFDLDLEMRNKKGKVKKDDTVGVKCLTTIIRFKESNKDEKVATNQDDGDDGFVIRANTLPAYLETNRYLLTRLSTSSTFKSILPILIPSNETSNQATATEPLISTSSHVSNDSLVGENVKIGDRTTIKKSVIGKSSILSKNVKLMGCVIGEKVRVGESSKLDLCILASNCKVGEKCVLKDCDVGPGAVVPAGTNAKGEKYSVEEEDGDEEDDGLVGEDEE